MSGAQRYTSDEAEQALLGVLLADNSALQGIDALAPETFADAARGSVFRVIVDLIGKGRDANPITVADRLADDEGFVSLGGKQFLADLYADTPIVANVADYAEIIADHATRRALHAAGHEIADAAWRDRERDAAEIALEAERTIVEIARSGTSRDAWCDAETAALRAYHRARAGNGPPGVQTGLRQLDAVLGGLRPSTLNLVAGRPGAGKSAAGVQIAINVAQQGLGAAFYSLEMPEEQCSVRFTSSLAYDRFAIQYSGRSNNPTYEQIERGDLDANQWARVDHAMAAIQGLPIQLDFRSKLTVTQMTAASRRLIRTWQRQGIKPGVIVIDHFLHIGAEKGARGEAAERYTTIANDLLHMAKSLEVPILLLCQLNRGVEGREDKRPGLADLKWTGALEENAFSVSFLYRPAYYVKPPVDGRDDGAWAQYERDRDRTANQLLWLVEKNRGGRSNQQVETFVDIGCNAILDLEPMR